MGQCHGGGRRSQSTGAATPVMPLEALQTVPELPADEKACGTSGGLGRARPALSTIPEGRAEGGDTPTPTSTPTAGVPSSPHPEYTVRGDTWPMIDRSTLPQSSRRFLSYDLLPDPVIVLDRDSHILFANTACQMVLGYDAAALVGDSIQRLIPASYGLNHAGLTRSFRVGAASTVVQGGGRLIEVCRADGTKCAMRLTVRMPPDGTYFVGLLCDMTRYVQETHKLDHAFQVYLMHEFRNNLQAVFGALELAKHADTLASSQAPLEFAKVGSRNMLHMMVSLARVNSLDSMAFQLQKRDLSGFELMESFEKACAIATDIHAADFELGRLYKVDMSAILQMITPLLSNAGRYAFASIEVRVSSKQVDETTVALTIDVSNDGPPIPAAKQQIIFDKYGRLRTGDEAAHGGCGLGLYICRKLARLHNGDVLLTSPTEGGSGCKFSIQLWIKCKELLASGAFTMRSPRQRATSSIGRSPVEPEFITQPILRILVVDDARSNCVLMRSMLLKLCVPGTDLQIAENGAECRQKVKDFQPGLLLLDENMPDEQGSAIVPFVLSTAPNCVIASCTGADDADLSQKLHEVGVHHVLCKPVTKQDLLQLLSSFPHLKCHLDSTLLPIDSAHARPGLVMR